MLKPRKQNQQGSSSVTSEPRIVPKPDLRGWNRGRYTVPDNVSTPERREYARQRREDQRVTETRWKVDHGVVVRYGDDRRVYTGACQRPGCDRWYEVVRTPGNVSGRWPLYCSETCRDIAAGTRNRKAAKRVRDGLTDGRKRPDVHRFDPEALPKGEPYWVAESIVMGDVTSTPTAYRQASEYLDEADTDLVEGFATARPVDFRR